MKILPQQLVPVKCSVTYSSPLEGLASLSYLWIRCKLALYVSFFPPSPLSGSKHTKGGKVQDPTDLWMGIYHRCLLQPELPLSGVLPKSASCLRHLLYWYSALAALADFPWVSHLNAWTLRVDVSTTLIIKPVKNVTRKKSYRTMCLRNMGVKTLNKILGNWIQTHRQSCTSWPGGINPRGASLL